MSGDSTDNSTMAILLQSLTNILKKDVISKPAVFCSSSISACKHIELVTNYCTFIGATTEIDKAMVLWDSLTDGCKNEIIFHKDYDVNKDKFSWLKEVFLSMFPQQSNKTTDLLKLNQVKQNGRSLQEYLSTVKQECAKRRSNFSSNELQQVAVSLFISGLDDELFRKALKQQNPSHIDEAFKLLKNIKSESESTFFKFNEKTNECKNCSEEIKNLSSRIDYLQKLIVDLQRTVLSKNSHRSFQNNQRNNNNYNEQQKRKYEPRQQERRGFSSSPKLPRCFNCGQLGHIQRHCQKKISHFRRMAENEESSLHSYSVQSDRVNWPKEQDAVSSPSAPECLENYCAVISREKCNSNSGHLNCKKGMQTLDSQKKLSYKDTLQKNKYYPKDVLLLERFVNDERILRKEKKQLSKLLSMTVITSANTEKARNKPIVKGSANNKEAKMFLDTGADINIIDKNFALNVLQISPSNITQSTSNIRCANGTKLHVLGECKINICIGEAAQELKFTVVDKVFPSIIIGIVGMKQLKISLCPEQSCAFTGKTMVQFLSKVDDMPKNGEGLCLRVETKLN